MTSHYRTVGHGRQKGGDGAKAEAARLLAEGFKVAEVARRVGVRRETVSRWAHHDAAPEVAAEKEKRAATFNDSVAEARAKLKDAAGKAADVLVAHLAAADPAVAGAAARTLLDRVGVPRAEVVVSGPEPLDLSGLTDAELELFERIMRKAGGR